MEYRFLLEQNEIILLGICLISLGQGGAITAIKSKIIGKPKRYLETSMDMHNLNKTESLPSLLVCFISYSYMNLEIHSFLIGAE